MVQAALFFYGRSVALQAAREGVSELRLAQTPAAFRAAEPGAEDRTQQFAAAVGRQSLARPRAAATYNDVAGTVTVTVTGHVVSLVGFTLSVSQTATGTVERFEPDTS